MHSDGISADADSKRLTVALALIVGFMAVEVVAGIIVHSLALLSDAAHMLTDAGAFAMSLVVIRLVRRSAGGNLTYGLKRTEILSAQANGATLLVLAGLIIPASPRSPPTCSSRPATTATASVASSSRCSTSASESTITTLQVDHSHGEELLTIRPTRA